MGRKIPSQLPDMEAAPRRGRSFYACWIAAWISGFFRLSLPHLLTPVSDQESNSGLLSDIGISSAKLLTTNYSL
jgi:hypothetical protein